MLSVTLYLNINVKCIINDQIDGRLLFNDSPLTILEISNKHPVPIKGLFLINIIIQRRNLKSMAFTKVSALNVTKLNLYNIDMLQDIQRK